LYKIFARYKLLHLIEVKYIAIACNIPLLIYDDYSYIIHIERRMSRSIDQL